MPRALKLTEAVSEPLIDGRRSKRMAVGRKMLVPVVGWAALLSGCAADPAQPSMTEQPAASILASSTPVAGSTVSRPVDELVLQFDPAARLDEVTVNGPDGLMPMMISPAGESQRYALPLSGLEAGIYTIAWRATAMEREHRGRFQFSVKD